MSSSLPSGFDGLTIPTRKLPRGYQYRVTRYADIILRDAFTEHWRDLTQALEAFTVELSRDVLGGGGNRSQVAIKFDHLLKERGWGKINMDIETRINRQLVAQVRSHEIDMFKLGAGNDFPGVAVEMEWNNKDPFFDRDLSNFYALHRAGALAVGVILTRGQAVQQVLGPLDRSKFGASTTHWAKLMPRVDVGGGGECPLFLVGIGPERIAGFSAAARRVARS